MAIIASIIRYCYEKPKDVLYVSIGLIIFALLGPSYIKGIPPIVMTVSFLLGIVLLIVASFILKEQGYGPVLDDEGGEEE